MAGGNDGAVSLDDTARAVELDDHTLELKDIDSLRAYCSEQFRALRSIQGERDRYKAEVAREVERLEAECDALTLPMEQEITRLLRCIENGAQALRALEGDEAKREWMFPYGAVGLTVRQASVVLAGSSSDLLPWAKESAPQLVTSEVVEKVDTAAAKRLVRIAGDVVVDADGEVVAGFRVKPRSETWDFKPLGVE